MKDRLKIVHSLKKTEFVFEAAVRAGSDDMVEKAKIFLRCLIHEGVDLSKAYFSADNITQQ